MSGEKCNHWGGVGVGRCRNKPYATRTLWDGSEVPGLCRKHTIQELRKFEEDNRQLAFYLRYRHLLEAAS